MQTTIWQLQNAINHDTARCGVTQRVCARPRGASNCEWYSSGPIGRFVPRDVVRIIRYMRDDPDAS